MALAVEKFIFLLDWSLRPRTPMQAPVLQGQAHPVYGVAEVLGDFHEVMNYGVFRLS